jgi:hypothetical protein
MAASAKQYLIVDDDGKGHLPVRGTPEERAAMRQLLGMNASELSHDRIRELLDKQLTKYWPDGDGSTTARIAEVYPSCAIVERDGDQCRMPYTVEDGAVKTSKPEEVTTKYVPASELGAARAALMSEVAEYIETHRCPAAIALQEVTRLHPELWENYSKLVMRAV